MKRENVISIFQKFFDRNLAPLGFVLRTPSFAECALEGMRQGVVWKFEESASSSSFGCNAFWAFTHELDDAPPNAGFGNYGKSLSGACTPDIQVWDTVITESHVERRLQEVLKEDLAVLIRLGSVNRVLAEIKRHPRTAHLLIGDDKVVAPFNLAFCLEIAGRKPEAKQLYEAIVRNLADDGSDLASRCREAAQKRAAALSGFDANA